MTRDIIFLLLAAGTTGALGNFLLKVGVNQIGNFDLALSALVSTLGKLGTNGAVIIGFIFYGLSSFLYLKLLAGADVTKIYPITVAYMFIALLVLGSLFLKEPLTVTKILGMGVILAGIILASR